MNLDSAIFTSEERMLNSNTTFIRSLARTYSLFDFEDDSILHGHDFIEIAFVVGGTAVHQMTSKDEGIYSMAIGKGDVLFINPGDFHTFVFGKGEVLEIENIVIDPVALSTSYFSLFQEKESDNFFFKHREMSIAARASQPLKLSEDELARVLSVAQKMRSPEVAMSPKASRMIQILLIELLYALDDIFKEGATNIPVGKDTGIYKAILFVQNNYTDKITVDDVAKVACCSRRQVERMYKYYTGETIINNINRFRISRACFLLTNSNMKITAIALEIGFDNISYFNKMFKARMGVTPKEFRQNAKQK